MSVRMKNAANDIGKYRLRLVLHEQNSTKICFVFMELNGIEPSTF